MRRYIIPLLITYLVCGCKKIDVDCIGHSAAQVSINNVEVSADGRIKVTATLASESMTMVSSRTTTYEDVIYGGWCLIFGEDYSNDETVSTYGYGDASPLIQSVPITANADGTFYMTFDSFEDNVFIQMMVNLTDRENEFISNITTWQEIAEADDETDDLLNATQTPSYAQVEEYTSSAGLGTFAMFRHQSVGLDGIYNMSYETEAKLTHFDAGFQNSDDETTTYWSIVYSTAGSTYTGINSTNGAAESYNTNSPSPTTLKTTGFPMSSYGFVMPNITEDSVSDMFGKLIYMIRVCSKVVVEVDAASGFTMEEIYMIDAAQEARLRSTVMSSSDEDQDGEITVSSTFSIPQNLGGIISYSALSVANGATTSSPIYFYPSSGGDYQLSSGGVDQEVNPQYIVIKGQAAGYDTPGYYKVALKAQYPLSSQSDESNMDDRTMWSALTYDILRNTSFTVNLLNIDNAGYQTYADAADANNPANNISYSLTIESSDSRFEILVNNGTYYTELETSRIYIKGYMDEGATDCYIDLSIFPSEDNVVPAIYLQASNFKQEYTSDEVTIDHCLVLRNDDSGYDSDDWSKATLYNSEPNNSGDGVDGDMVQIPSSDKTSKVRVVFSAYDSGYIRLRIGDILRFIPVVYDRAAISMYGSESVVVADTYGQSWSDFSYTDIVADNLTNDMVSSDFELLPDGSVTHTTKGNYTSKPELRARISPTNAGDGIAVLYLRQARDFRLLNSNGDEILDDSSLDAPIYSVEYTAQAKVWANNTSGIFTTENDGDGTQYIKFTTDGSGINAEGVDDAVISISLTDTTVDETGAAVVQPNYWNKEVSDDGHTLTFVATKIQYEINGAYSDYEEGFVRYNNTAETVVTLTNSAGDTKTYTVDHTQHPPIYLVSNSYGEAKEYNMYQTWWQAIALGDLPEVFIHVLNIYNYNSDCRINYNWASNSTSDVVDQLSIHEIDSTTGEYYYTNDTYEYMTIGGLSNIDYAIGLFRNDIYDSEPNNGEAYFTVEVEDRFGEIYTTTQTIKGV